MVKYHLKPGQSILMDPKTGKPSYGPYYTDTNSPEYERWQGMRDSGATLSFGEYLRDYTSPTRQEHFNSDPRLNPPRAGGGGGGGHSSPSTPPPAATPPTATSPPSDLTLEGLNPTYGPLAKTTLPSVTQVRPTMNPVTGEWEQRPNTGAYSPITGRWVDNVATIPGLQDLWAAYPSAGHSGGPLTSAPGGPGLSPPVTGLGAGAESAARPGTGGSGEETGTQGPSSIGDVWSTYKGGEAGVQGAADEVVNAGVVAEENRLIAAHENQVRAEETLQGIQEAVDSGKDFLDQISSSATESWSGIRDAIDGARLALHSLPGAVWGRFTAGRQALNDLLTTGLGQLEQAKTDALGRVMRGMGMAVNSMMQGIDGNVKQGMAEIDNNLDLTDAQKTQMKAQIRLGGAMAKGQVAGSVVKDFQAIQSQVDTSMSALIENYQGVAASLTAQYESGAATATAQAESLVHDIGSKLTGLAIDADKSYFSAMDITANIREAYDALGGQLAVATLPARETPYADLTGVALFNYDHFRDLWLTDFRAAAGLLGMDWARDSASAAMNVGFLQSLAGTLFSIFTGDWGSAVAGGIGTFSNWSALQQFG